MKKTLREFTIAEIAILTGVNKRIPNIWAKKGKMKSSWSEGKRVISEQEAKGIVEKRGFVWEERLELLSTKPKNPVEILNLPFYVPQDKIELQDLGKNRVMTPPNTAEYLDITYEELMHLDALNGARVHSHGNLFFIAEDVVAYKAQLQFKKKSA